MSDSGFAIRPTREVVDQSKTYYNEAGGILLEKCWNKIQKLETQRAEIDREIRVCESMIWDMFYRPTRKAEYEKEGEKLK